MSLWFENIQRWARAIKHDVVALWLAARDPRVPLSAKIVAAAVAAYALSPIDLIPDFIPVFGYLDDLIVVPLGILLAAKLIGPSLMGEFRQAAALLESRPKSMSGLVAIVALWLAAAVLMLWLLLPTHLTAAKPQPTLLKELSHLFTAGAFDRPAAVRDGKFVSTASLTHQLW